MVRPTSLYFNLSLDKVKGISSEASNSILKEGYEKAVVITDGWASMKKENLEALKKRKVKTLTILLSKSHKEPDCFKELGSIVKLRDAII
jgi:ornithine carbamoyltransferase